MDSLVPDSIEIEAIRWVQNGYTIGYEPEGRPLFLHGALPGERVVVTRVAERSSHGFGVVRGVVTPSPDRMESDCPVFPLCGGCSFRHISYEAERGIKLMLLHELKHLPVDRLLPENLLFANRNGYRNHVRIRHAEGRIGFFGLHSHEIVPLPPGGCRNLSERLNEKIRATVPIENGELRFRETGDDAFNHDELIDREYLEEPLRADGSLRWLFPSQGFFQSNRFLLPLWLETIESLVPSGLPRTVELFAGSGLLGGYCRAKLGDYIGYESDRAAIGAARLNFERASFRGRFERRDLYRSVPELKGAQLLLVNPPRAGINRPVLDAISSSKIETIIYSSCSPQTLNRDLGHLARGGYRIGALKIFDFFPGTPHVEVVVQLQK